MYHNCREDIKYSKIDYSTKLTEDLAPFSKYIHTKDWGTFKIRKNGRLFLMIGTELVRVQFKGSYFDGFRKESK